MQEQEYVNDFRGHVGRPDFEPMAGYRPTEDGRHVIYRQSDGLFAPQEPEPRLVERIKKIWPTAVPVFNRTLGYWQLLETDPKWLAAGGTMDIYTFQTWSWGYVPLDDRAVQMLERARDLAEQEDPVAADKRMAEEEREIRAKREQSLQDDSRRQIVDRVKHTPKIKQNFERGVICLEQDPAEFRDSGPKIISVPKGTN